MTIDFKKLAEPFSERDIEWRVGRAGETNGRVWAACLAYINARAVQERLDEVVGPGNWKDRYWREGQAVMCGLSIRVDGEWIEKVDGAEETDIEAVKGGLSAALKRAAVKWGIGRYLYNLTEAFAEIVEKSRDAEYGKYKDKDKKEHGFYWLPPRMPTWALPNGDLEKRQLKPAAMEKHPAPSQRIEQPADDIPAFSSPANRDPGAFVMPLGKNKGKKLEDIGVYELNNWLTYMNKQSNLSQMATQAYGEVEAFLETRTPEAAKQRMGK